MGSSAVTLGLHNTLRNCVIFLHGATDNLNGEVTSFQFCFCFAYLEGHDVFALLFSCKINISKLS